MNKTTVARLGHNELCRCGSGRKYKRRCLDKDESEARVTFAKAIAESPEPFARCCAGVSAGTKTRYGAALEGGCHAFQRVRTPRKVGGS